MLTYMPIHIISSEDDYHYGHNGMLKVNEIAGLCNHYAPLHGEFTPKNGLRWNKDEWNSSQSISPYVIFDNNPIWKSDPLGDDPSTDVTKESNGTYKVAGGKDDGDKNMYVVGGDGKRTGEVVGQSLTPNSFLGDNGKAITGAVINPTDQSGNNFLNNEILNNTPSLGKYIANARNGEPYDFKDRGINDRPEGTTKDQYRYRGMPFNAGGSKTTYGSARDFGNFGAGFMAGKNGMNWRDARLGFDGLQSWKDKTISIEGKLTQQAERAGFKLGFSEWQQQQPIIQSFRSSDVYQAFPPK
jgi:hypothetical protein